MSISSLDVADENNEILKKFILEDLPSATNETGFQRRSEHGEEAKIYTPQTEVTLDF
jgi:hypothetical protein